MYTLSVFLLNIIFEKGGTVFARRNSIIMIALATSFLIFFKNINIPYNKFINIISSTTFGIYLLHDNQYLRKFLWGDLLNNSLYDSNYLILHASISIIIVFISFSIVDLIRQHLFEKPFFKLLDKKWDNWSNRISSSFNAALNKIENSKSKDIDD